MTLLATAALSKELAVFCVSSAVSKMAHRYALRACCRMQTQVVCKHVKKCAIVDASVPSHLVSLAAGLFQKKEIVMHQCKQV